MYQNGTLVLSMILLRLSKLTIGANHTYMGSKQDNDYNRMD